MPVGPTRWAVQSGQRILSPWLFSFCLHIWKGVSLLLAPAPGHALADPFLLVAPESRRQNLELHFSGEEEQEREGWGRGGERGVRIPASVLAWEEGWPSAGSLRASPSGRPEGFQMWPPRDSGSGCAAVGCPQDPQCGKGGAPPPGLTSGHACRSPRWDAPPAQPLRAQGRASLHVASASLCQCRRPLSGWGR